MALSILHAVIVVFAFNRNLYLSILGTIPLGSCIKIVVVIANLNTCEVSFSFF